MSNEMVVELGQEVLWITALLSAPLLLSALAVGLFIGIIQAATQVQEMTLSFIPKLLAMAAALFIGGSWMLGLLVEYTQRLYQSIPGIVG